LVVPVAKRCPSEQPMYTLLESIAKALGREADPGRLVGEVLLLRTPHLEHLLGGHRESSLWINSKHERHHRKRGMAIGQSKAALYAVAALDALGVFVEVDELFYDKLEVPLVVQKRQDYVMTAEDHACLHDLRVELDARAQPWIAATLGVWDELVAALDPLCGAGFVRLSIGVDRLASRALRVSLARFVEALVEHQSRAAYTAARSRPTARPGPEGLVVEIRRHHRIHDPDDVRWMAEHWEQVRELVAAAIARGCVETIGQVAPVLTHFSHVFEGALPEPDRLRVQMVACIQDQAAAVGADVAWFEKIEGRGFLLLSTRNFAGLDHLVGDDAFEEHEAKIAESIRCRRALNDSDRTAHEALATLHRLRAHQLAHRQELAAADHHFAVAAATASQARNESLEIATLLDRVRMLSTSPRVPALRRTILQHLERADALAWAKPVPNRRRLVNLHLLRAELLLPANRFDEASIQLNKAEHFWRDAQIECRGLVYQQELLERINQLRAALPGKSNVVPTSPGRAELGDAPGLQPRAPARGRGWHPA
jgi:hypothetical protein